MPLSIIFIDHKSGGGAFFTQLLCQQTSIEALFHLLPGTVYVPGNTQTSALVKSEIFRLNRLYFLTLFCRFTTNLSLADALVDDTVYYHCYAPLVDQDPIWFWFGINTIHLGR